MMRDDVEEPANDLGSPTTLTPPRETAPAGQLETAQRDLLKAAEERGALRREAEDLRAQLAALDTGRTAEPGAGTANLLEYINSLITQRDAAERQGGEDRRLASARYDALVAMLNGEDRPESVVLRPSAAVESRVYQLLAAEINLRQVAARIEQLLTAERELEAARPVLDAIIPLVAASERSTAPRTPMYAALIAAVHRWRAAMPTEPLRFDPSIVIDDAALEALARGLAGDNHG